jgi:hypothetical protein
VLYWFRTPPGVKVGRAALDEDALRRIEAQNPDLEFDWPKILKGGGAPPPEPRPPVEVRRPRSGVRPRSPEAPPSRDVRGLTPVAPPPAPPEPRIDPDGGQTPERSAPAAADGRGLTPVDLPAEGTPAHEKIGQEGVLRLRQRYADVRARILERAADPARRDELMASAERINPDAWTTADAVASGLEQYEAVLATLREVVGRKRRRRKRGGGRRADGTSEPATESGEPQAQAAGAAPETDDDSGADDEPGDFGAGGL